MADRLNEIKKQVVNENSMEPPTPSNVEGMKQSIVEQEQPEVQKEAAPVAAPVENNAANVTAPEVMPPTPGQGVAMPPVQPQPIQNNVEMFQELAESIINEKWEELISSVGNITLWKEKVQTDILSIKQELIRVEDRFENLQKAILGRVEDYHRTISDVGGDIKALEQVFEKILQPLTSNIKELGKITDTLKKRK